MYILIIKFWAGIKGTLRKRGRLMAPTCLQVEDELNITWSFCHRNQHPTAFAVSSYVVMKGQMTDQLLFVTSIEEDLKAVLESWRLGVSC